MTGIQVLALIFLIGSGLLFLLFLWLLLKKKKKIYVFSFISSGIYLSATVFILIITYVKESLSPLMVVLSEILTLVIFGGSTCMMGWISRKMEQNAKAGGKTKDQTG